VYRWLACDRSAEVDQILAAALPHAESPYFEQLATLLWQRKNEIAWAGLVAEYRRLAPELRQELRSDARLLKAAVATVLAQTGSEGRLNALHLLVEHPCPQLAYLVADALRDPATEVRAAAAAVLCATAEQVLSYPQPTGLQAASARAAMAEERAALAKALREALRTFEVHQRQDVLEICLWLARDLGDCLWNALCGRRSVAGHIVARHLKSWNHPRLAGFLLLALGRPAWQRAALNVLSTWNSRNETIALLQNSDLLADPAVRHNLHLWKHPRWLALHGAALAELPPEARAQFPLWACYLGLTHEERMRYLMVWQASPWPEVSRAAVYALAALDVPESDAVLADLAARPGPLQHFARWFIVGRRWARENGLGPVSREGARRVPRPGVASASREVLA